MFADYSIKKPRKSTIYEALIVAGVGNQPTFCTPKQEKIKEIKCY